ncbi:MAG: hypothetical protein LBC98_10035 [Prevotellaceae bacterium]|nr:hypothetical protein [Prevotellaceae bacterium]
MKIVENVHPAGNIISKKKENLGFMSCFSEPSKVSSFRRDSLFHPYHSFIAYNSRISI